MQGPTRLALLAATFVLMITSQGDVQPAGRMPEVPEPGEDEEGIFIIGEDELEAHRVAKQEAKRTTQAMRRLAEAIGRLTKQVEQRAPGK
jgi:hypothetical protein